MSYIDSFIIPVPKKKLATYRTWARLGSKIWRGHGALAYVESLGDDVPKGKWTSFPRSVKLKANEVVVFSYIVYKSKADRNRINKLVMTDARMTKLFDPKKMPFDAKRMIFGGFKAFVET